MTALAQDAVLARQGAARRRRALPPFYAVFRAAALACGLLVLAVLLGILAAMIYGGWPVFREFGFAGFLTGSVWDVNNDRYGAWPAVAGTPPFVSARCVRCSPPTGAGLRRRRAPR